jgi:hypothetical protein
MNVAVATWLALCAVGIVLLRPRQTEMQLLGLFLAAQAAWWLFRGGAGALAIVSSTAGSVALAFFIAYLARFGAPPSPARRVLAIAAYVFDAANATIAFLPLLEQWLPAVGSSIALARASLLLELLLDTCILASCTLAYAASKSHHRLAALTIVPALVVVLAMFTLHALMLAQLPAAVSFAATVEAVVTILAPLGFLAAALTGGEALSQP